MNGAEDDIPVLSEIIQRGAPRQPASQPALEVTREVTREGAPQKAGATAARLANTLDSLAPAGDLGQIFARNAPPPRLSRGEWEELERRVRDAVLDDLHAQIGQSLQQHIEDQTIAAVDRTMSELAAEIKRSLRDHLRAAISAAVAQEIALLQGLPDEIQRT